MVIEGEQKVVKRRPDVAGTGSGYTEEEKVNHLGMTDGQWLMAIKF